MLRDRDVTTIVVGLPLNMDGSEGPAARAARLFADRMAAALKVEVDMFDERLTSFEAEERLKGMPVKRGARKPAIDAIAATVILEGWMQSRGEKISRQ
jgi:putative Holliday junction resolvase